jgi:O-antigen/teichoic acid export membrane protein
VAILARLIDARGFGVFAIATPYLLLAGIVSDPGLNSSVLYLRSATQGARDTVFWAGTVWSIFIALCLCGAAPILSNFYREDDLTWVLVASAPSLPLQFVARQIEVTREKSLQFKRIVLSEILAVLAGAALAVFLASCGFGPLSFAAPVTIPAAIRAVIAWGLLAEGWKPKLRLAVSELLPSLRYGVPLAVAVGANTLATSLDLLVGGLVLSVDELGQYGVLRQFVLFLSQFLTLAINRVTVPVFANIRDFTNQAIDADRTARRLITMAVTLLFGCIAASPDFVCRTVLGSTSASAGSTMAILSIWGWARTLTSYDLALLTAIGRVRTLALFQITVALISTLPLYAGARFGLDGLAWASALCGSGATVALWYLHVRPRFGVSTFSILLTMARVLTCLFVAASLATAIGGALMPRETHLHFGLLVIASITLMAIADSAARQQVMTVFRVFERPLR